MKREMRIMMGVNSAAKDVFREFGIEPKAGDTRHYWDGDKPEEVETARKLFDSLVAKGYKAFRVGRFDRKGDRLTEFDPRAEGFIMVAQMAGG